MYCTKCGAEIVDDSWFCIGCGAKVERPQSTAVHPGKGKKTAVIAGTVCLGAALIAGVSVLAWSSNKKETGTQTNISSDQPADDVSMAMAETSAAGESQEAFPEMTEASQTEIDAAGISLQDDKTVPDNIPVPEEESSEYILINSDTRFLTRHDLQGLNADECRLARNEIYARYGRKFDDEGLQNYFDTCSWYQGTIEPNEFQESMLNAIELANRDLIVIYEKEMGYR